MNIGDFLFQKMPKNCRLSFHQNLILTQQTSIPIMKFEVLWAYEEVSAKIAMWGDPEGPCWIGVLKNFRVAWRIREGPNPKTFGVIWERVWAPLQATQENFWFMLNHGLNQLLIFPLIEISGAPKGPPRVHKGFFQVGVSWGAVLSTLTQFGQNLKTPFWTERTGESWKPC